MPHTVYTLCVLTCLGCAALLYRAFRRRRQRLLLWSSIFFLILGVANVLLFVDLVIFPEPEVNLLPYRSAVTLCAVVVLIAGLIFESD
jgi:heme A synthase